MTVGGWLLIVAVVVVVVGWTVAVAADWRGDAAQEVVDGE